ATSTHDAALNPQSVKAGVWILLSMIGVPRAPRVQRTSGSCDVGGEPRIPELRSFSIPHRAPRSTPKNKRALRAGTEGSPRNLTPRNGRYWSERCVAEV